MWLIFCCIGLALLAGIAAAYLVQLCDPHYKCHEAPAPSVQLNKVFFMFLLIAPPPGRCEKCLLGGWPLDLEWRPFYASLTLSLSLISLWIC